MRVAPAKDVHGTEWYLLEVWWEQLRDLGTVGSVPSSVQGSLRAIYSPFRRRVLPQVCSNDPIDSKIKFEVDFLFTGASQLRSEIPFVRTWLFDGMLPPAEGCCTRLLPR